MHIAVPQPNAWGTPIQRKAGFIYVTVQLCRAIKSLLLRGGLIIPIVHRISTYLSYAGPVRACPVQVVQRYGQWCVHRRCSKLMSRAGGGVYPGFWLFAVPDMVFSPFLVILHICTQFLLRSPTFSL